MNKEIQSNVVVYNDGELELQVSVNDETIWMNQKQLAELFSVESHTINYHMKNIFKQRELNKNPTTLKIRVVQKEGKREIDLKYLTMKNKITFYMQPKCNKKQL